MPMPQPSHLGISSIGSQTISASVSNGGLVDIETVVGLRAEVGVFWNEDQDENGDFPCGYSGYDAYTNYYKVRNPINPDLPLIGYIYGTEGATFEFNNTTCQIEETEVLTGACLIYDREFWITTGEPTTVGGATPSPVARSCRDTSGGTGSSIQNTRNFWTLTNTYLGNQQVSANLNNFTLDLSITNSINPTPVIVQANNTWSVVQHTAEDVVYNVSSDNYEQGAVTVTASTTYNELIATPYWGKHDEHASLVDAQTNEPFELGNLSDIPPIYDEYDYGLVTHVGTYGGEIRATNNYRGEWRLTADYQISIYEYATNTTTDTNESTTMTVVAGDEPVLHVFSTAIPGGSHEVISQSISITKYEEKNASDEWLEKDAPDCKSILIETRRTWFQERGDDTEQNQNIVEVYDTSKPMTAPRCGGSDHNYLTAATTTTQQYDKHGNWFLSEAPVELVTSKTTDAGQFVGDLITTDELLEKLPGQAITISNSNHTSESFTINAYGFTYNEMTVNDVE